MTSVNRPTEPAGAPGVPVIAADPAPSAASAASGAERVAERDRRFQEALAEAGLASAGPVLGLRGLSVARLSFAQERLWFLHQLDPGSAAYNVAVAVRLVGGLDVGALGSALAGLVARHEVLRSSVVFDEGLGFPVQRVGAVGGVDLPVVEVAADRVGSVAAGVAVEPFDLAVGPLVRAVLLRVGAGEHVLVLVVHHVVVDAWSLGVAVGELSGLYDAAVRGVEPGLVLPAVQYADFAVWQREWLVGERLERQVTFWREGLAGLPALGLPTDFLRPAVVGSAGGEWSFRVGSATVGAMEALAAEGGATLFMVLLAGCEAVLGAYAGQSDFGVGTPVAGRTRAEVEHTVGFFVNTVVMRADVSGDPSFRELVGRVRSTALAAFDHQDVPFERLVEVLAPERSLDTTPLFQVMVGLQNAPRQDLHLTGLEVHDVPVLTSSTMFDLNLTFARTPDGLDGIITYRSDLFRPETVTRFTDHLDQLLQQATQQPDTALSALDLATETERAVRAATVDGRPLERSEQLVHELVWAQAERTPDAIAVRDDQGRVLSYRQLRDEARALAGQLRTAGVGPEVLVGLCLERSTAQVVGLLAVAEAGGASVLLDLDQPADRLRSMADSAGLNLALVGTSEHGRQLGLGATSRLTADLLLATDPERPDGAGRPPGTPRPDQLAYVIFTSGSTGAPKGVMVSHKALGGQLRWLLSDYPLTDSDRVLQKTGIGFDASVWEFWAPLVSGAQLVLARPGGERDLDYLLDVLEAEQITVVQLLPSLLDVLCRSGRFRLPALRRVCCGGEALTVSLVRRFAAVSDADLVNLYGPAETCVQSVAGTVDPAAESGRVAIGLPVAGMSARVVNPAGYEQPVGVPGELMIAGDNLARGYLGRPDLTAERFVPDPYGPPGGRAYHSGDRAVRGPDGTLQFLGRMDRQVKIRGVRVEPGEVEEALRSRPEVVDAVVVTRSRAGQAELVACLVADPQRAAFAVDLGAALGDRLPTALRPAHYVWSEAIPRLPNGKVDRLAVLAAVEQQPEAAADRDEDEAPRTPGEKTVCAAFARVLGVGRVAPTRSFFDLGGNSLQAMRLVVGLREELGVRVAVADLFQAPTPRGLSGRLAEQHFDLPEPVVADPPLDRAPLSAAQRRLWFLTRLDPGRHDLHVSVALRLHGPLDTEVLTAALRALADRHPLLRAHVEGTGSAPEMVTDEAAEADVDVRAVAAADLADALRLAIEEPLDLAVRCWRARILRLDQDDHVLMLCLHHLVTDGRSTEILVEDLVELYRAADRGAVEMPPPGARARYADYAVWEQAAASAPSRAGDLAYWVERLAGCRPVDLGPPPERPEPEATGSLTFEIGPEQRAAVAQAGTAARTTLNTALLAMLGLALREVTGRDDLTLGLDIAVRPFAVFDRVVGPCLNQVVLRLRLRPGMRYQEWFADVSGAMAEAQQHGTVAFEEVVSAVQPERRGRQEPLVAIKVVHQQTRPIPEVEGLRFEPVDLPDRPSRSDVTLFLADDGERIGVDLRFATAAVDRHRMQQLADTFLAAVDTASAIRPDEVVSGSPESRKEVAMSEPTSSRGPSDAAVEDRTTGEDGAGATQPPDFFSVVPEPVEDRAPGAEDPGPDAAPPGTSLPAYIDAPHPAPPLAEWIGGHRDEVDAELHRAGAVLFRGFTVAGAEEFEAVAASLTDSLLEENGEHTPVPGSGHVQVPVAFPPDKTLLLHNENSFNPRWPQRLVFCCVEVPDRGGESTLADSRAVYAALDPEVRREFESRGVMYERTFHPGLGVSWQQIYGTDDRAEVEQTCRRDEVEWEWLDGGGLRTTSVRPAVVDHPVTGERCWFAQIQHWHTGFLDPGTRASLESLFARPEDQPRRCRYGDGEEIAPEVVTEICDTYDRLHVSMPWTTGDVLVVDNVAASHGRLPYEGTRTLLVALGDETSFEAVGAR